MADKVTKKGLGAGLGALFGDETDISSENGIMTLPISKVEPKMDQPRKAFDDDALSELAESIEKYGIIQPITVRALRNDYYQIIAGERRWRAARLAGLSEVPVRIIEADDRRAAELALVENLQREDLNPIEEAKGLKTLMEEYGLSQEEAANAVGKSRPAVANSLRLLSLSPHVLDMTQSGELSSGHARALLGIQDPAQQLAAAKKVVQQGLSVRQTEALAARMAKSGGVQGRTTTGIEVDYAAQVEAELRKALGRKAKIVDGRKKGRIELEYYGADDREALIEALLKLGKI